jgi:hypothetical protein
MARWLACIGLGAALLGAPCGPVEAHALMATPPPRVAAQKTRLTSDASRRVDLEAAIARFREHERTLRRAAERYGVPEELLAIPFVESRYRSLEERENSRRCCAGLWQLDRRTARMLGLEVSRATDERLDVEKASDAALRHLADLRGELGSWSAAVVAYNIGKTRLRRIMRRCGTDDPWALAERREIGPFLIRVAGASLAMADVLHAPEGQRVRLVLAAP